MAQGYLILPLNGALQPDGSGTGNAFAKPVYDVSTGTPATNSPKVTTFCWDFTNVEEHLVWSFMLPGDIGGGLLIRLKWRMVSAITGNVNFKASSYSGYDESSDDLGPVFDTVQTAGATPVPGTLGQTKEFAFSLASAASAAHRKTNLMIGSDVTGWTAAGALRLVAATLEYGRA